MKEAGGMGRDQFVEDPECHTKNETRRPANMYVALISNKAVCPVFIWLISFNPLNNPLRQAESIFCRSGLRPERLNHQLTHGRTRILLRQHGSGVHICNQSHFSGSDQVGKGLGSF